MGAQAGHVGVEAQQLEGRIAAIAGLSDAQRVRLLSAEGVAAAIESLLEAAPTREAAGAALDAVAMAPLWAAYSYITEQLDAERYHLTQPASAERLQDTLRRRYPAPPPGRNPAPVGEPPRRRWGRWVLAGLALMWALNTCAGGAGGGSSGSAGSAGSSDDRSAPAPADATAWLDVGECLERDGEYMVEASCSDSGAGYQVIQQASSPAGCPGATVAWLDVDDTRVACVGHR